MHASKQIIDFLLNGVRRLPVAEHAEALCAMFAGLLPGMSEPDIAVARNQVLLRFGDRPDSAEAVLDLMEGHLALRSMMIDDDEDL